MENEFSTVKSLTFAKLDKGKHEFNLEYNISGNSSVDPLE